MAGMTAKEIALIRAIYSIGNGSETVPQDFMDDPTVLFHLGVSGGKDSVAALLKLRYESDIDPKRLICTMSDTQNEDPLTYAFVNKVLSRHHPVTILDSEGFLPLCQRKGIFPSRKRQFCTEELKIHVTSRHLQQLNETNVVVACSGSRLEEGKAHNKRGIFPNFEEYSPYWRTPAWRPCNDWSLGQVWDIAKKYISLDEVIQLVEDDPTLQHRHELIRRIRRNGIPRNPLYDMGAKRVGCLPCINSVKAEIRAIVYFRPERIAEIAGWEEIMSEQTENAKSFFHRKTVPEAHRTVDWADPETGEIMKVCSIHDVARWSETKRGGKQFEIYLHEDEKERSYNICKRTGLCE